MAQATTPYADADGLLRQLSWEPIEQHPDSPVFGDVIMYRDGGWTVVGSASQVSYGPREQMQAVARLFPRGAADPQEDAALRRSLAGNKADELGLAEQREGSAES